MRCRAGTRPSGRRLVGCGRGWVGRAGGPGVFWCAAPFLLPFCSSFGPLRAMCALVVRVFLFFFFFADAPCVPLAFFPALGALGFGALWLPRPRLPSFCSLLFAPPLCPSLRCFRPSVPWASALCAPPPPLLFFFLPPLSLLLRCFRPWAPWAVVLCGCPPPPPPLFFWCRAPPCCAVLLCAVFRRVWCRGALLCVVVFSLVLCSVPVRCVNCCLVRHVLLRCIGCVGLSCSPSSLLLPSLSDLLLLRGLVSCSVVGCGAVWLCCAACAAVCCRLHRFLLCGALSSWCAGWCSVLVRVVSGCPLLGLFVCCCLLVAVFVAGVPAWPRGLLSCCLLWIVVVPCSLVLCPIVLCFRAVLCCGALLSILLCWWCLFILCPVFGQGAGWPCCAAFGVLFVDPRAVFCSAFFAALCRAVLTRLHCFPLLCSVAFVVLVGILWCCLWIVVARHRVLMSAVFSWRRIAASASLVLPCCVLRCAMVLCCPVLSPAVLCCLVVLCCRALQ